MPAAIEPAMLAASSLVGMARLQLLHARTKEALDAIHAAQELADWRDVPDSTDFEELLSGIETGAIRPDTQWSNGPDPVLVALADAAEGAA